MSAAPRLRLALVADQAAGLDGEYAGDHWHASRLGVPARRGRGTARFDTITQDWLRNPVKRWSRLRLAAGCAFATIDAGALAMARFSAFLADRHPGITSEAGITRQVLEDYLSWLLDKGYSAGTRALTLSMLRVFTEACHRHDWLPRLVPGAVIYVEELPPHHDRWPSSSPSS
jgi:integrase family protein with SAM-like domain